MVSFRVSLSKHDRAMASPKKLQIANEQTEPNRKYQNPHAPIAGRLPVASIDKRRLRKIYPNGSLIRLKTARGPLIFAPNRLSEFDSETASWNTPIWGLLFFSTISVIRTGDSAGRKIDSLNHHVNEAARTPNKASARTVTLAATGSVRKMIVHGQRSAQDTFLTMTGWSLMVAHER